MIKTWWNERAFLYEMEKGYYVILSTNRACITWHSPFCNEDCIVPKINSREWWLDFGVERYNCKWNKSFSTYGCILGLEFTLSCLK